MCAYTHAHTHICLVLVFFPTSFIYMIRLIQQLFTEAPKQISLFALGNTGIPWR